MPMPMPNEDEDVTFSMEAEGTSATPNLAQAQDRIIKILEDIYQHDGAQRSTLQMSAVNVYAGERVAEWLTTTNDYWQAVTSGLTDVLMRYPLRGRGKLI